MSESSQRLKGRICVITGASRGIGRAAALRFAREGAQVIPIARTQAALEELDDEIQDITGEPATLVPLDITDFDAIDRVGAALFERFGRIDVLVGNAAILGTLTPITQIRPEEWDQVLNVNLTANWRLLRSMHPLLQASDSGRAIFLSSGTTAQARAYWATYAVSKIALEHMAQIYAAENAKTPIRCNILDPGATRTGMRAAAFPGEDPKTLKTPDALGDALVELASPQCARNGEVVRITE